MGRTNFNNLTSGRYKACGYGAPQYDRWGDYDEVLCTYGNCNNKCELCGEGPCPLDSQDREEVY